METNNRPPLDSIDVNARDTFNPIRRVKREMDDNGWTDPHAEQMWLLESALHHAVDVAGMLSEYCPDAIGVRVATGRGYRIVKE